MALDEPYTTLSHRWGGSSLLQLTWDNLHDFRRAISIVDMPKTFQQAIYVSKALGARYIWIDSLCIVQDKDDLSDWTREASQMHQVYAHSYCNLSASDALDSSQGLSRQRHTTFLDPTEVNFASPRSRDNESGRSVYTLEDNWLFRREVSDCALNKRGWVLQERFLSPRVLHFCRYQLYWECRSCVACEKYPNGIPSTYIDQNSTFKAKEHSMGTDPAFWYQSWDNLVGEYTNALLTFPHDKLVALSGLAKRIRSATGDQYVAGLWRENLEYNLLWYRSRYHNKSAARDHSTFRPHQYRAPSWSWASLDGSILAFNSTKKASDDFRLDIHVKDVHLQYASDDDTGQVTGGWLDLCGRLKPMRLLVNNLGDIGSWNRWNIAFEDVGLSIYFSVDLDEPLTDEAVMMDYSESGLLFCMPVVPASIDRCMGYWIEDEKLDEYQRSAQAYYEGYEGMILLFRLVNRRTNEFQRMGIGETLDEESRDQLHKELDEETKRTLPCLRYENGRHTIRVI